MKQILDYVHRGWKVFPCKPGEKVPATSHGVKDAVLAKSTVKQWWTQNPEFNVGIATGKESGIVVLDVDGEAGRSTLAKIREQVDSNSLNTYTVYTPSGGLHLYYEAPMVQLKNRVRMLPGLDLRSNGGYVVAPPSKIGDRNYETAIHGCIRPCPAWLIELAQNEQHRAKIVSSDGSVAEGSRNQHLFEMGCRMRRLGLDFNVISAALIAENEDKCNPPLFEGEVAKIANSASKYEPGDPVNVTELQKTSNTIVTAQELCEAMCTYLADKDTVRGQSYYLPELDKALGGGMRKGEVTAWHAEAKVGKNTLWHKLMHLQLENGQSVGYASRELTPETEVLPNILSIHFKENIWLSKNVKAARFSPILKNWSLFFANGYGYFPLSEMKLWISELKQRGVTQFWFDHLHYMLEDPEEFKTASKLIKELKTLAKSEDVHINIIIQPNKLSYGQELGRNSIKGGAAMGQAIDNLFVLERVWNTQSVMKVKLECARSKLCELDHFYLKYDSKTTDMTVVDKAEIDHKETQPVAYDSNQLDLFAQQAPYLNKR